MTRRQGLFVAALVVANVYYLTIWTSPVAVASAALGDCGSQTGNCTCMPVCSGGYPTDIEECFEVPEPVEWSCISDNGCSNCCC